MGHTDASFTMSVYQQVLDAGSGSMAALEQVLGGAPEHARDILCGTAAAGVFPLPP